MNIFGFRPFKGKFNLGNSDDIPENQDGTLIGSIKQINTALNAKLNSELLITIAKSWSSGVNVTANAWSTLYNISNYSHTRTEYGTAFATFSGNVNLASPVRVTGTGDVQIYHTQSTSCYQIEGLLYKFS